MGGCDCAPVRTHTRTHARSHAGTLDLVAADLLQDGSFDAAVAGCRYVFHTASPFFIEAKDPEVRDQECVCKAEGWLASSPRRARSASPPPPLAPPQAELVQPALHGTRNVFSSVVKSKDTVQRVILTSSCAGAPGAGGGKVHGGQRCSQKCVGCQCASAALPLPPTSPPAPHPTPTLLDKRSHQGHEPAAAQVGQHVLRGGLEHNVDGGQR